MRAFRIVAVAIVFAWTAACAAPVEDSMAQRLKACTACHGQEDRVARDAYYPRIAGKPAGYLYNQLLNFRDGRRHYALMNGLLQPLGDDYLREIADYFASLEWPYPARPAAAAMPARGRQLVLHGDAERRVPACVACHGAALTGVAPAVPGLLGLPRDYLVRQLGAWRVGERHALAPDCMAEIAQRLAPDDVAALSSWLAAQPLLADTRPAGTVPADWPMPCGGLTSTRR